MQQRKTKEARLTILRKLTDLRNVICIRLKEEGGVK
jgi:hypothetical protein